MVALEERLSPVPLCVDLDGTLVRSDTLHETFISASVLLRRPSGIRSLIRHGRAGLKQHLARYAKLDVRTLPYNEELLDYLREQKAAGRRLVLVTGADHAIADAVNEHLQLFDDVIASDGTVNLTGRAKARMLIARFGEKGFDYAGNGRPDLVVWRAARAAVLVNTPPGVTAAAGRAATVERHFDGRASQLKALVKAMRPYQWVKNILVFVPLLTAHAYADFGAWSAASLTFLAFCAIASAIYLVNDLVDIQSDRLHARKRFRPFASGKLSVPTGLGAALALLAVGASLAAGAHAAFGIACYVALSLSYSARLKERPLVDVFILAALYSVRMFAGGQAVGHPVSLWLLGFSSFLFLSLALVKRVEELREIAEQGVTRTARRGYFVEDLDLLTIFGVASTFSSALVLALFVQSEASEELYAMPQLLWGIVPLMLFWQCRLWLSTVRGQMHDDPILYAAFDWVSWAVVACLVVILIFAKWASFIVY